MSDSELLEAAARAAGLKEWGWMADTLAHIVNNQLVFWNPLTDDGDAFRLAVKLNIRVCPMAANPEGLAYISHDDLVEAIIEEHGSDSCAAVRRAITRAAAAIGGMSSDPSGKGE